jgi:DNA-binding response OmpR family regulator
MNILIVEDTREIADFLETSLTKEGYVVDLAYDGISGLNKACMNEYDLLVLDIGLPLKDGKEVCRELRAQGNGVPILMLSVKGEIGTKVELLKLGADDYITKPFSYDELSARIGALLRRPRELQDTVTRVGQLAVDTDRHVVTYKDKEIKLTLKEFLLLEYMVRNRGRVLTRLELLEHVWDMNADPFTNTIETHVRNIRRKIGVEKRNQLIRTVSGVGYKIE